MKEKDTKIPSKTTHDEDCGYTVTGRPCNCSCGADDTPTPDTTPSKFIVGDNFSVSQKDSTICDKPMQHLSCPACGVRWIDHMGVEGVCRENARLKEELDNISAESVHSCHPFCQRPACVARRERDEARELSEKRRKSLSDFIDLNNELRNERDEARAEITEALMLAEHPDITTLKEMAQEMNYRGQRILELERERDAARAEAERLREAIRDFVNGQSWAADTWKQSRHIRPLFDIAEETK